MFEVVNVHLNRSLSVEGIKVTVRTQFGTDIDAACGQLYGHNK